MRYFGNPIVCYSTSIIFFSIVWWKDSLSSILDVCMINRITLKSCVSLCELLLLFFVLKLIASTLKLPLAQQL